MKAKKAALLGMAAACEEIIGLAGLLQKIIAEDTEDSSINLDDTEEYENIIQEIEVTLSKMRLKMMASTRSEFLN